MYFSIVIDDDLVVVDGVAAKTPFSKSDIPDWAEVIWWDGEKGMLQHRDTTQSVFIDNYDDYQPILDAYYQEINKQIDEEKITPEQQARSIRNYVRDQTDKLFSPGYTIQDELLADDQRGELLEYCISLAKWPKQANWPNTTLPAPPAWLAPLLSLPEWPVADE